MLLPMLPPPRPCPCLRRHHCCSLCHVIAPLTLLPMVGCCVICRPLPAALSAVQILSAPTVVRCVVDAFSDGPPSPFADHRQPLYVALLPSINRLPRSCCKLVAAFSARPAAQRPHHQAENISSFHFLLRVSTCKRMKNLRGCQFSYLSSYDLISNDSSVHVGKCVGDTIPRHDFVGKKRPT